MFEDIDQTMTDLHANVSFGGGGGRSGGGGGSGGFLGRINSALSAGRARAVSRGGGYSDGGNWRTALDTNANGRVTDDVVLGVGIVASVSPAGRVVNTVAAGATVVGAVDHFR